MKTSAKMAAIGAASTIAVVALLLAYPVMAAPNGNTYGNSLQGSSPTSGSATTSTGLSQRIVPTPTALTVGQTLTLTSTNGQYRVVGGHGEGGVASGRVTLTVTGVFEAGYSLSMTSGSLDINGTTYSIASGSAQMGERQAHLAGQGSLASATPGSFLFAAGTHANFQGQSFDTLRFDLQTNGAEYGVVLLVSASYS